MARVGGLWLPTDPPSLPRAPRAPDMFDHSPHRNRGMRGIANDQSSREWDNRLIATAVALGCPRPIAEQARTHPPARYALLTVWCDVQDASDGDKAARERVDRYRTAFANAAVNAFGEMLDAREQPADSGELQTLMGLD